MVDRNQIITSKQVDAKIPDELEIVDFDRAVTHRFDMDMLQADMEQIRKNGFQNGKAYVLIPSKYGHLKLSTLNSHLSGFRREVQKDQNRILVYGLKGQRNLKTKN